MSCIPDIQFPNFTPFVHGGGPIIKGKLFPFLFVTIACGAISGFHSLVSSGTTPKMLDKETDARFIGYGAMLCESLVGVLALIAACSMNPGDYFAINCPPAVFAKLGTAYGEPGYVLREVGEKLAGRSGGAVSLAVGMAQIFRGLPGMARLMGYWYHYAIMFEALFILTTVDTGTRVARYVLQELMGKVYKPFGNNAWLPGNLSATTLVVAGWGYLIWTGNISTIWPLFGTGNQLLATIALAVSTTFLINMGKASYAWITFLPMCFVGVTTISAGVLSIQNIFWPLRLKPGRVSPGIWIRRLMVIFITGVVLVLIDAIRRWIMVLNGAPVPEEAFGPAGPREERSEDALLLGGCGVDISREFEAWGLGESGWSRSTRLSESIACRFRPVAKSTFVGRIRVRLMSFFQPSECHSGTVEACYPRTELLSLFGPEVTGR